MLFCLKICVCCAFSGFQWWWNDRAACACPTDSGADEGWRSRHCTDSGISNVSLPLTLFYFCWHKCVFLKLHHAEGWRPTCHGNEGFHRKSGTKRTNFWVHLKCISENCMGYRCREGSLYTQRKKGSVRPFESHLFSFLSCLKQKNFQFIQALPRSSECYLMAITGSLQSLTSVIHFGSHFTFKCFFKENQALLWNASSLAEHISFEVKLKQRHIHPQIQRS